MKQPNPNLPLLLSQGLGQLHLSLNASIQGQLLDYLQLLIQWNQAYNLTAIRDPEAMVIRHVLDSLAIGPLLRTEGNYLDVGTGAGLPGLVLAIAYPHQSFYLLDSLGKRILFLNKVVRDLKLSNVTIIESRAERYQSKQPFAIIMSRAFASLSDFIYYTKHLADENTQYCALKGKIDEREIQPILENIEHLKIDAVKVPFLAEERHLVSFNLNLKRGETNAD